MCHFLALKGTGGMGGVKDFGLGGASETLNNVS